MLLMRISLLFIFSIYFSVQAFAQVPNGVLLNADTLQRKEIDNKKKSTQQITISSTVKLKKNSRVPWKAAVMSACLPGLGQMYNRKWWKVPIVWGGIGTLAYFGISNHLNFIEFRDAYRNRVNGLPTVYDGIYSDVGLITQRDNFQRSRDLFFIIGGVVWILNIVDATVDAHLSTFDVSRNLSMSIQPASGYLQPLNTTYVGVSVGFHIK